MPTFEELSQHTSYPVLHAQRKDEVVIVATRVPLADIRLQQWGWVLSQAYTIEQPSHNGFDGLVDGTGKKYSKIYTLSDMQHYIETWECKDWETGYFSIGKTASSRVTIHLEDKIVQEEDFKKSIEDLRNFQETQTSQILNAVSKQGETFQGSLKDVTAKVQTAVFEKVDNQASQMQITLLEKIEQQPHLSLQDLSEHFNKLDEKQSFHLESLMVIVKSIQENIDGIKEALVPVDIDEENANTDDTINKLSTSVKTLSDRYVTSLINTNTKYHNTVDRQVKDSFKLTRIMLYVGIGLFALTIISLLVTFFFHSGEIAIITSGIGAALSAIATGIGGLNKFHDDAANRQLQTLSALSRSVKAAHAQFVIEQVNDDTWKKNQFEKLLSQYLISDGK